ncbi:MAG: DUF2608 domain-containing protein, partial [Deltaproteobacteria bacterium]|nr:DUF2608 domain-containing protein [Deltaproteobacteria bacterium]
NMDHLGGAGLNQDDVKKLGLKKPNTISFASGILFTEGQHKGAMLRTLFFKSRIPVSAAVFIDNRKKHTQKVAAAFEGRSTKMFTVHYFYKDIDTKPLTAFPDIISRSKAEWAMIKRFIE